MSTPRQAHCASIEVYGQSVSVPVISLSDLHGDSLSSLISTPGLHISASSSSASLHPSQGPLRSTSNMSALSEAVSEAMLEPGSPLRSPPAVACSPFASHRLDTQMQLSGVPEHPHLAALRGGGVRGSSDSIRTRSGIAQQHFEAGDEEPLLAKQHCLAQLIGDYNETEPGTPARDAALQAIWSYYLCNAEDLEASFMQLNLGLPPGADDRSSVSRRHSAFS